MPHTAIVWMIIYFVGAGASFVIDPFYGLMTYMFEYYTHKSWAKGVFPPLRYSFVVAGVIMIAYFIHWNKFRNRSFSDPSLKYLLILLVNMAILTPFAISVELSYVRLIEFLKLAGLYYFIGRIVRDRKRYKQFIWLQVWGNFLFGWHGYNKSGELVHGRLEGVGGVDTSESNHLANHTVMILPFIGNMVFFGNKWVRIAALMAAPLIINSLILCNSRGAFLAMIVMVISFLFLSSVIKIRGFRTRMIIGLVLGSILFLWLTNAQFWERIWTIQTYEEEAGAIHRMAAWNGAVQMIKDHPLGSGGDGWYQYSSVKFPELAGSEGRIISIHNTFLVLITDWGIQGLVLYTLFLTVTFIQLHKIRKRNGSKDDLFFKSESLAIEIALIGFLVSAFFLNRFYAECLFWYCALATALNNMQLKELEENKGLDHQPSTKK